MATTPLTEEQFERYARHLTLPEVGLAGQQRLLGSRVAVVGAGGLGSPVVMYLAAAGVGRIDVIDPDVVDLSNLQRQPIHRHSGLGMGKAESARRAVKELNPDVAVEAHGVYLTEENAMELLGPADVVVDGCDNFPTRYLTNDACYFLKKPLIYGGLSRFEGQVTTFRAGLGEGPCYRCLFPEAPPPELVRPCREVGVLGVLPGVIGMLQATEAIKALLGLGEGLVGRLLVYDALGMTFRCVRFGRDSGCALCGDRPTILRLAEYGWRACGDALQPPHLQ